MQGLVVSLGEAVDETAVLEAGKGHTCSLAIWAFDLPGVSLLDKLHLRSVSPPAVRVPILCHIFST